MFEYEVEGGAIPLRGDSSQPGHRLCRQHPQRARLLDLELVHMFDALLAHSGSNEWIRQYILESD